MFKGSTSCHSKKRATALAKASGFDKALSQNKFYEGHDVFLAANESGDFFAMIRGWPAFILVNETTVRWATHDEIVAIMDMPNTRRRKPTTDDI